jgi:hypothetical protein
MDNTARLVSKNQSQKPNRYHGAGGVARYGLPMHESLGPSFNTKERGLKGIEGVYSRFTLIINLASTKQNHICTWGQLNDFSKIISLR